MTELKTVAVQGALEEIQSLAPSLAGMMADMLGSTKVRWGMRSPGWIQGIGIWG